MGECSCGIHSIVVGSVPDPGCIIHGEKGINAWTTCPDCLRVYRNVVGHQCEGNDQ